MNARIIYQNDEGGVSVIVPADPAMTIEQIAAKDVPAGKAYKIIDASDCRIEQPAMSGSTKPSVLKTTNASYLRQKIPLSCTDHLDARKGKNFTRPAFKTASSRYCYRAYF